jgi:hypothetical protein
VGLSAVLPICKNKLLNLVCFTVHYSKVQAEDLATSQTCNSVFLDTTNCRTPAIKFESSLKKSILMKENFNRNKFYSGYLRSIWSSHSITVGSEMFVPLNHQAMKAFLVEFYPTVKQWYTANVRWRDFRLSWQRV